MRQLLQTLFFFLLVTQICFAQWYQQNSGTTWTLRSVCFIDSNNGWVVGGYTQSLPHGGIILSTINGGIDWIAQLEIQLSLVSVFFADPNNGWVVGEIGTILRTTDGGTEWTLQSSGTTEWLNSVCFTDTNNGTAVGTSGTILKTTNGGTDWSPQSSGTTEWLNSVCLIDANNGWVVGENGTILVTTNGGTEWTLQSSGTTTSLNSVNFIGEEKGWTVGMGLDSLGYDYGIILNTSDGGINWALQMSEVSGGLNGVFFNDANNGTAVGVGIILRTTDGGLNWGEQTSEVNNYWSSVSFTDTLTGWIVGSDGTILHTTNGGVPVELSSFIATSNGKEVLLSWSTATELNNLGFEIQRSIKGVDFFTVGFVKGNGTTTELHNYSYADRNLSNGKYFYRLKQVDYDGSSEYSEVVEVEWRAFNSYLLEQNYPNPFNPTTTIGFGLQSKSNVKITILNAIGEEVAVLLNEEKEPGYHNVEFNAINLPSGVYFYQLKTGSYIETKKMLLLK